jgi:cation:H+ antiporter
MSVLLPVLLIVLGLVLLVKGADLFVSGASSLARKLNMSELAIGLTIVAFGTSAPELIVNVFSAAEGHHDLVFGNVIGSNNLNLFIILGIAGVIIPLNVQSSTAWREIPFSILIIFILYILANDQLLFSSPASLIGLMDGILLFAVFMLFLFYVYKQLKTEIPEDHKSSQKLSTLRTWVYIIIGMAGLIAGGRIVVKNAVDLAIQLDVSEKIIGLTIIALGTSLPELATSVVAAIKKNADIAVGNIIGSNIFNILLILSISSFVKPLEYNPVFNTDIYILAGGSIFLYLAMYTGKRKKLDKWEAFLLLAFYLGYTVYLIQNQA